MAENHILFCLFLGRGSGFICAGQVTQADKIGPVFAAWCVSEKPNVSGGCRQSHLPDCLSKPMRKHMTDLPANAADALLDTDILRLTKSRPIPSYNLTVQFIQKRNCIQGVTPRLVL